jgi:hypothetical protein
VLTAPIPGSSTPNLPFGGAIFTGLSIPLLLNLSFFRSLAIVEARFNEAAIILPQKEESLVLQHAASMHRTASNDARTTPVLQTARRVQNAADALHKTLVTFRNMQSIVEKYASLPLT